jgi:ribosomal-protein-alanine N-acetyltransferase
MPGFTEPGTAVRTKGLIVLGYNVFVDLSLREFRREDFDLLWSIDQECFPPGIAYSRRELADYIRRRGSFTLVAETVEVDGNRTSRAGSASLNGFVVAEASSRGVGHIITIDVLPAARRSGAGSQLLKAAEDRLRAANCHTVILETAVDNKIALAFYKRHQYELIKTLPRYYSNGVDALVLQKDLLSPSNPAKLPR